MGAGNVGSDALEGDADHQEADGVGAAAAVRARQLAALRGIHHGRDHLQRLHHGDRLLRNGGGHRLLPQVQSSHDGVQLHLLRRGNAQDHRIRTRLLSRCVVSIRLLPRLHIIARPVLRRAPPCLPADSTDGAAVRHLCAPTSLRRLVSCDPVRARHSCRVHESDPPTRARAAECSGSSACCVFCGC